MSGPAKDCSCSDQQSQPPQPPPSRLAIPKSISGSGRSIPRTGGVSRVAGAASSKIATPYSGIPPAGSSRLAAPSSRISQAGSARTASPAPGIPKAGSSRISVPSQANVSTDTTGSSRIRPPGASRITTPSETGPKLIKSSVTTTSRDESGRPIQKTLTTTKQTIVTPSATTAAQRPAPAQRAGPSRLPSAGSRLQPPRIRAIPAHTSTVPAEAASFLETSQLTKEVERDLMEKSLSTGARATAKGTKSSPGGFRGPPPVIVTEEGTLPVDTQIILERRVERGEEGEHITELMTGMRPSDGRQHELVVQHFDPSAGLPVTEPPSREVITIKSSISVAGDVSQTAKTVVYEKTGPVELDMEEVSRMVEEENEAIEEGIKMAFARTRSPAKSSKKKEIAEELPEDIQPEMLAAIMHTEEQGIAMAAPPTQLYNFLFPDGGEGNSIPVSSVVPAPLQDVVVPTSTPREFFTGVDSDELQQAQASVAEKLQTSPRRPRDSMYAEANQGQVPRSSPPPVAPKVKKKKVASPKPLVEETPPWDDEEYQPIADLVGASPAPPVPMNFDFSIVEPERMFPSDTNGLEYILVPQPPSHVSRVQLRGTTKPSWFPGFYVALPDRGPGINIARSPSVVLASAWKEVQPATFTDNSFIVG